MERIFVNQIKMLFLSNMSELSFHNVSNSESTLYVCFVFEQIEMDKKYHDQICGLCGNFDSKPNDLELNGKIVYSNVEWINGFELHWE